MRSLPLNPLVVRLASEWLHPIRQAYDIRHLAAMKGEMGNQTHERFHHTSKMGVRMRRAEPGRVQFFHDAPKDSDRLVELRQQHRLGRRLGLGELPFAVAYITAAAQLRTHEVVQVACQMQDEMPDRIAGIDRLRPELFLCERLGKLPHGVALLLKLLDDRLAEQLGGVDSHDWVLHKQKRAGPDETRPYSIGLRRRNRLAA